MSAINVGFLDYPAPPAAKPIQGSTNVDDGAHPNGTQVSTTRKLVRRITFYNASGSVIYVGLNSDAPAALLAGTVAAPGEYTVVAPDDAPINLQDLVLGGASVTIDWLAIL